MDISYSLKSDFQGIEFSEEITEDVSYESQDVGDGDICYKSSNKYWSTKNAVVPFIHELSVCLNFSLIIEGHILQRSSGFAINFCYSSCCKNSPNIAFHFNPKFGQNYVARNSKFDECWGKEESVSGQRFPFKQGEGFFLEIYFSQREYLVAINGFHFCSFHYRHPISYIKWIEIIGGLKILSIETNLSKCYPVIPPSQYLSKIFKLTPTSTLDLNLNNQKILDPPIMAELRESFRPGCTLKISGKVKMLPHSFTINLQNGKTFWPRPLVNLHINARFNYSEKTEHVVVLNSWLHESWDVEQIPGFCSFSPGDNFILNIFCARDAFEIIVNNELLAVYKYRAILGLIDTIYIFGDLIINEISTCLEIPQPNIPHIVK